MNQQQVHESCPESPENVPLCPVHPESPETDPRSGPTNWEAYSLEVLSAFLDG